jgi:hypothetical protein
MKNMDIYEDKYYSENGYLVTVYFRLDRKYNTYNRQIYSLT